MTGPRFLCAAIVAGALLMPGNALALGRLFTTEAQRYQLEHADAPQSGPPQPSRGEESVLLNGFVQDRQGHKTLWINGGMRDKGDGRVIVDANGRRITLKPGQMLDMRHHAIRDVFDPPAAHANPGEAP